MEGVGADGHGHTACLSAVSPHPCGHAVRKSQQDLIGSRRSGHIRREKASSNICSNEALCALTASIYMATMGPQGMAEVARQSMAKAHYLAKGLCAIEGVTLRYSGPFFHEFLTDLPRGEQVLAALEQAGILGGLPVEGGILWCATEKASKEALDQTIAIVKEVLAQ